MALFNGTSDVRANTCPPCAGGGVFPWAGGALVVGLLALLVPVGEVFPTR